MTKRFLKTLLFALALGQVVASVRPAFADTVFTLWPLVDYRSSDALNYSSCSLLGPLISYEAKGPEREIALRPLWFKASTQDSDDGFSEYLYPLGGSRQQDQQSSWQFIKLLSSDSGTAEQNRPREFTLFPIIFSGETKERGSYFAVFPIGGTIFEKFKKDEIRFVLFPLYGRTERKGTRITNVVWPFFAKIEGPDESGFKFWPLYGASQKEGVYRKRYWLWPFFYRYDLGLDTENPVHERGFFPFYVSEESPKRSRRTVLWPFFNRTENYEKGYSELDAPWPLVRFAHGEKHDVTRILPLFADEQIDVRRKRWFLWPIYKIEEIKSPILERRRDRVLFFLYSNLNERDLSQDRLRIHRTALWPLFNYQNVDGVTTFSTLALLEPFFPDNQAIERNWAPLYRLYIHKQDQNGNEISSLLWNLYWHEKRQNASAGELFPIFSWQQSPAQGYDWRILKGLFGVGRGPEGRCLHLFWLTWSLGDGNTAAMN